MAIAKRTRKQIEKHITTCAESIQKNGLEIGRDLIEIRDEELWADEYLSWNEYLKERAAELVGRSFAQSASLIRAAEIRCKLPESSTVDCTTLNATHMTELGRLAPEAKGGQGQAKDYSKLRKQDVARVIKAAGPDPSVRDIRAAVDDELGLDRAKERKKKQQAAEMERQRIAAKAREKAEAERERERAKRELGNYLTDLSVRLREASKNLSKVPAQGWDELEATKPGLCELVAQAADELSNLMRS